VLGSRHFWLAAKKMLLTDGAWDEYYQWKGAKKALGSTIRPATAMKLDDFVANCVFIDIEITRPGRVARLGAVCADAVFQRNGRFKVREGLESLDRFVAGVRAQYIAGHNLIKHDWNILRGIAPNLRLLRLPVVDTLFFSPLAFPQNPYHSLVKDYKLVRDAVNDPVADSRLSAKVFRDEWKVFANMVASEEKDLLSLYRFCFADTIPAEQGPIRTDGFVRVFERLGALPVEADTAREIFQRFVGDYVCSSALADLPNWMASERWRAALAYATAWLRVAGGNSVLPPWVRIEFPEVVEMLRRLREMPCNDSSCGYCSRAHDPLGQLNRYFHFDQFRPTPTAPDGSSLQETVVRHGMGDRPLLAILPTGGGKSLCYQLPAMVRNFRRGVLTVVLSPLQALMKDQVDNFVNKTGSSAAVALSGLLTPPERGQVLERVRLGDVGLLYISPEQLRNKSTIDAIKQREIGCWVFDEAHCLSKWGHDFRPDYLYASRFIRELAEKQNTPIPPIACFTATAKRDVVREILAHFRNELGQELALFEGGVERENLRFEVLLASRAEKFSRVGDLLAERLSDEGSAVVYTATRKAAERLAEYLGRQGWEAAAFHAGLSPPDKRRIQDDFIAGETRVICATNAFGMGIDKDDVRMVVHADMPGSLENYLQEAGRAGRDSKLAECVLLYGEDDVETQFSLAALSQLTRRDIAQILRGLRRAKRKSDVLVLTSGELLRDEDVDASFDIQDSMADTKVKTAVAWLERAGFVQRNHNATYVFQGKPRVASLEEAEERVVRLGLPPQKCRQWLEILQTLINTDGPEGLNADLLAELPSFHDPAPRAETNGNEPATASQQVLRTLDEMAHAGLIQKGVQLSAYVSYKVEKNSQHQLKVASQIETALLKLMQEQEPDAAEQDWLSVSLRRLNQALVDQGLDSSPEVVRNLLTSLSMDGRGFAGSHGSLEFRHSYGDFYRVKLHRDWPALVATSERRRDVAGVVLRAILEKIPTHTSAAAGLLVEFSSDDLTRAVETDLVLKNQIRDVLAAVDRGLMYLHEQRAIILQHGLSIFRQAMTIRLTPESKGRRYTKGDFDPLQRHYGERILQVHVMYEYARRGLESIAEGLKLVLAYFAEPRSKFIARFFGDRKDVIQRAIAGEAYQRIVDDLRHPVQQAVVAAPDDDNLLILAGPGSGKTRTIVHRVAYLVRVKRVRAQSVLVLCFNRLAAIQLKRRIRELIGPAAARVTVLTYHGLAARLTGSSFAESATRGGDDPIDLAELIPAATCILCGQQPVAGVEPDELRDRLLAGYRFILVDEYQDIDEQQYELISALTNRGGRDREEKLSILAVGDDDQNIYSFRGSSVAYIRRFQNDYQAHCHYLLDNYRSTANIIAAANELIAHNQDRMKTGKAIRIDQARQRDPAGGPWQSLDPVGRGSVQVLHLADQRHEAAAVTAEIERIGRLPDSFDYSSVAVLARTRDALHPIRAACEHRGIPVLWGLDGDRTPRLHRIREIACFLDRLHERRDQNCRASDLLEPPAPASSNKNPWRDLLVQLLSDWREETADAELPVDHAIQYIHESLAEQRREQRVGRGVFMSTVHAAKGTEFDHVLIPCAGWTAGGDQTKREEERRLYYVAMTRARHTLCLFNAATPAHPHVRMLQGSFLLHRKAVVSGGIPDAAYGRRYELLGLEDIDVGYAGSRPQNHPIHAALARLEPGNRLQIRERNDQLELIDARGCCVARLSKSAVDRWRPRKDRVEEVRIVGILRRQRSDERPEYRDRCRCDAWEVPLAELVYIKT